MAFVLSTISERWLDEIIVEAISSNVDGALADTIPVPPGLGDVAIMEWTTYAQTIATLMTDPELHGVWATIETASKAVDNAGGARWQRDGTTGLYAFVQPDALVLWRQDELFTIRSPEVDTNAVPTVDYIVRIKCVRVRPVSISEQPAPIRLVR